MNRHSVDKAKLFANNKNDYAEMLARVTTDKQKEDIAEMERNPQHQEARGCYVSPLNCVNKRKINETKRMRNKNG